MKKLSFSRNWSKLPSKLFVVWLRHYKLLFFLLFVVVASWSGYEWRRNLFTYSWSGEERQKYLEATIKETAFQEEDFLLVLKKLEEVSQKHSQSFTSERELFMGEPGEGGTHQQ